MAQLKSEQWQAIRTSYENDVDNPTVEVAAERAALKFDFKAPHRSSIYEKIKKDEVGGKPWVRVSSMHGINIVAQKKADRIAIDKTTTEKPDNKPDAKPDQKPEPDTNLIKKVQASKEESEDLRAAVLVRHREDLGAARNAAIAAKRKHKKAVTLDDKRIAFAKQYGEKVGLPKNGLEFQMLYGIRRDLQENLAKEGYPVRVYVPFGTHWYPYFMRRLAERPANVWFFISNFFKK